MDNSACSDSFRISLQSKDHGQLLDVIDRLRSEGISRYVPLPQIIVCGDQSSGKSSVLEAVSGVRFPTKDNLCTRFATELVLRRGLTTSVTVAITPGSERSSEEREMLLKFKAPTLNMDEFSSMIDSAKEAMGINSHTKAFSDDVLRVEISGPEQPHLTLVDLPGVIHAENKQQSAKDVQLVLSLVRSYMASSRSIILAVVSAKNDYANQIVTTLAREVDPKGFRTLGIITKPDTLHAGSESEMMFLNLARNEEVVFRLGWHVLRNRDYDSRDCSITERDQQEREFFSQGVWTSLSPSFVGIGALKPRLSTILKDQIVSELPGLIRDVQSGIEDCKTRLRRLGEARGTLHEQRQYLVRVSRSFSSLVKAALDGTYFNEFFGDAMTEVGFSKRLRAVIQNCLLDFADDMRYEGHSQEIIEDDSIVDDIMVPRQITRSDFLDHVRDLMTRTRGRELPGTFNPLIVGDLFFQQSKPWKQLADRFCSRILDAIRTFLELVLERTADESTSEGLLREVVDPAVEKCTVFLQNKIREILRPHQRGHPITYNHYFLETVQKARKEHSRKEQAKKINAFFRHKGSDSECIYREFTTGDLLQALSPQMEVDMDRFACSEAMQCMNAYYKVAMKVMVDNFAALGIEQCLLENLSEIFSPDNVMELDESFIRIIAAESEASSSERAYATKKLNSLEAALRSLIRLARQKLAGESTDCNGLALMFHLVEVLMNVR
ncbi:dynamin family protein [Macrophomina phaseolina]|uniref:Dynamin family protein n=1 Tax=Macrophomina phaseolina TaxID=35725 RepID=A0ABQ8FUJ4_9PEZI|nr:dynamin family protein [Macrophomina phaseolina]